MERGGWGSAAPIGATCFVCIANCVCPFAGAQFKEREGVKGGRGDDNCDTSRCKIDADPLYRQRGEGNSTRQQWSTQTHRDTHTHTMEQLTDAALSCKLPTQVCKCLTST